MSGWKIGWQKSVELKIDLGLGKLSLIQPNLVFLSSPYHFTFLHYRHALWALFFHVPIRFFISATVVFGYDLVEETVAKVDVVFVEMSRDVMEKVDVLHVVCSSSLTRIWEEREGKRVVRGGEILWCRVSNETKLSPFYISQHPL